MRGVWENLSMEKAVIPVIAHHGVHAVDVQRSVVMAAILFVSYIALDWLTYVFPARFGITPFNPEAAVAIALLMVCGKRYVPLVFVAVLWGEYALPSASRPPALLIMNSAVLTACYAGIAHWLDGRFRLRFELDTQRDVMRLMGVTLACMLLCGVVYVGVLLAFGIGPADRYFNGARRFFIGYSVGVLIAAPLLFMAFRAKRRQQFREFFQSRQAWLQALTIAACVYWVFLQEPQEHAKHFYVFFLPLIWAAARFGMVGAASALALIQTGLFLVFYLGSYQPPSVFELQLLLIALAITGLLLGVSIDEQRRATADFRESLKLAAAGEMVAAITHEINQPLTALSGYATAGQLIAASAQPDRAQLNDTLAKLIDESKRTAAVVRRLRDFFRSGATQLERVDLDELVDRVIASLRTKAAAVQVAATRQSAGDMTVVWADALQLEVVLRNLLQNAIESAATSPGGRVEVTVTRSRAREILVTVHDNGPGIRATDAHGGRIWAVPGNLGMLCFALPLDVPSGVRSAAEGE
jgi:signal transduction histidine kinase